MSCWAENIVKIVAHRNNAALSSFWSWASDTRLHKPHSTHSCLKCTEAHWPRWETGLLLTHSHNFSLLFVCFAHTAAIWGSLRKMKKKQKPSTLPKVIKPEHHSITEERGSLESLAAAQWSRNFAFCSIFKIDVKGSVKMSEANMFPGSLQ